MRNISKHQGTLIHIPKDIANIIVKANVKITAIEISTRNRNVCIMVLLLPNIVSRLNYKVNLYSLSL